jgi:hypothetical protein
LTKCERQEFTVIFDQNTQLDTGNNLQVDLKRTPHAQTGPDKVNRTMRRRRKREEWVKVKRVHYPGGKQEKGKEGKEKGKQGEREEEWGREAEQQSQEGGGEKALAKDERVGERRNDRQGRSEGQECCQRHVHKLKLPHRQLW